MYRIEAECCSPWGGDGGDVLDLFVDLASTTHFEQKDLKDAAVWPDRAVLPPGVTQHDFNSYFQLVMGARRRKLDMRGICSGQPVSPGSGANPLKGLQ